MNTFRGMSNMIRKSYILMFKRNIWFMMKERGRDVSCQLDRVINFVLSARNGIHGTLILGKWDVHIVRGKW